MSYLNLQLEVQPILDRKLEHLFLIFFFPKNLLTKGKKPI